MADGAAPADGTYDLRLTVFDAASAGNFPYFQLGCLIVGGLTIVSLKQKFQKLYLSEAVGSFAMYAVLVALFTSPVADAIKNLM